MTIKQLDNPTPTQTPMRFTFRPQLQMIFWFKIPPPQILPSFFTIYSIGDITKMSKTWRKILPMPTPFTVGAHAIFFSFPYFTCQRFIYGCLYFRMQKICILLFKFKVPLKFLSPSTICENGLKMTAGST